MEHGSGTTSVVATPFDFDKAQSTRPKSHCVAVCVTSEDPDDGFKPAGWKVQVSYEYSLLSHFYSFHLSTLFSFIYFLDKKLE